MQTIFDYREMAREYLAQAEACDDPRRKETLLGIADLYNRTALAMQAANAAPRLQTAG